MGTAIPRHDLRDQFSLLWHLVRLGLSLDVDLCSLVLGNLFHLFNDVFFEKWDCADFENMNSSSETFWKTIRFQHTSKTYPWRCLRRRPPGAAELEGYFLQILSSKMLSVGSRTCF